MQKYVGGEIETLGTTEYVWSTAPSVIVLPDGGWLTTWGHQSAGWDYPALSHQQRFDAEGNKVGDINEINGIDFTLAALSGGGWVAGYGIMNQSGNDSDTYVNLYDEDGDPVFLDHRVNSYTALMQGFESITGLSDGGWIVTWSGHGDGHDQDFYEDLEIYQQRYDASGNLVDLNQLVNTTTEGAQLQSEAVALADGGWVVKWVSAGVASFDVHLQRFDENGDPVDGEVLVNNVETPMYGYGSTSSITALDDGGWLVTWNDLNYDEEAIYQQRYDADGNRVGEQVAVSTTGRPLKPRVEALAGGGWFICYSAYENDRLEERVVVFDEDGKQRGRQLVVDQSSGVQSVTALDDGRFVVTWAVEQATGIYEIRQRIFATTDNEGPIARNDTSSMAEGTRQIVDVLANDVDGDKDERLTLESATVVSGKADITFGDNGKIAVTDLSSLVRGQSSTITIEYEVSDGYETDTGLLKIKVRGVNNEGDVIRGSNGADRFHGTNVGEAFIGRGGNDRIEGAGGNDFLIGDGGNDAINAGDGRDTLVGGKGDDKLMGGTGSDLFIFAPGDGRDIIRQPSSWSAGTRDIIDLTAFGFKTTEQVQKLIDVKGHTVIIDLPGDDKITIIDTLGHGMFFTI